MIDEASEAAALWQATPIRLIVARENAVYEMALPDGHRAALRLHRAGYQGAAAIQAERWWCTELARMGLPVPEPIALRDIDTRKVEREIRARTLDRDRQMRCERFEVFLVTKAIGEWNVEARWWLSQREVALAMQ